MKIALIIPGSIWFAPYISNYTRILDEVGKDYSLISWNREGDDKAEGFQYTKKCENGHLSASFSDYWGYVRFIKKTLRENHFDRLIIFGPQMACLLSTYLLTHYRNRFMIDYRDLSIEQKTGFKQIFAIMTYFSKVNVVSSPGFIKCLPKRNYYLSHNFDEREVRKAIDNKLPIENRFMYSDNIKVLTIGAIRDFSSNIEVVKALENKDGFELQFVGRGNEAAELIKKHCKEVDVKNVSFVGSYEKPEEAGFVMNSTVLNIFYPRIITHDTALSNRFYNSLIYKRPMIVTKDTTQGDYAEIHGVGLAIKDCTKLSEQLQEFLSQDFCGYAKRCNELLKSFLKDQERFKSAVINFVK